MKLIDKVFLKFIIVGIINTMVGAAVMFLLYNVAKQSYWLSSACNYIVGGTVSFFLNKYFTFQNKKKSIKQVLYFIINLAVCYFIAYVFAKWLIYSVFVSQTESLKGNIALAFGMILYTGLNYLSQRFIVFKEVDSNE